MEQRAYQKWTRGLLLGLVLVLTAAYAAVVTHTELVWNAGHPIENEADDRLGLLTGKAGTSGDSLTIGGVTLPNGGYRPQQPGGRGAAWLLHDRQLLRQSA